MGWRCVNKAGIPQVTGYASTWDRTNYHNVAVNFLVIQDRTHYHNVAVILLNTIQYNIIQYNTILVGRTNYHNVAVVLPQRPHKLPQCSRHLTQRPHKLPQCSRHLTQRPHKLPQCSRHLTFHVLNRCQMTWENEKGAKKDIFWSTHPQIIPKLNHTLPYLPIQIWTNRHL